MNGQNWFSESEKYDARVYFSEIREKLLLYNQLFSQICESKVSLVNIFDDNMQYTISSYGEWENEVVPRDQSYCNKTISGSNLVELSSNKLNESKLHVHFPSGKLVQYYVGIPIRKSTGENFATLCAMDYRSHELSNKEKKWLRLLANQLEFTLQLYEANKSYKNINSELKTNEVQFLEIHHRIKNNLADICGLLQMEIGKTSSNKAREVLKKTVNRINAAIKLHELLYESINTESVNINEYINKLIEEFRIISEKQGMKLIIYCEIDDIKLDFSQSLPLGLILNELLTNAYHHAFKNKIRGIVSIEIHETDDGTVWLIMADNGQGFETPVTTQTSYGMKIIKLLAKQLNATFEFSNRGGSVFHMQFKKNGERPQESIKKVINRATRI